MARLSKQTTQDRKNSEMNVRPVYLWREKEEHGRLDTGAKFLLPLSGLPRPVQTRSAGCERRDRLCGGLPPMQMA